MAVNSVLQCHLGCRNIFCHPDIRNHTQHALMFECTWTRLRMWFWGSVFVCFYLFLSLFRAWAVSFLSCVWVCLHLSVHYMNHFAGDKITWMAGIPDNPYPIPIWSLFLSPHSELPYPRLGALLVLECKSKLESSSYMPKQAGWTVPKQILHGFVLVFLDMSQRCPCHMLLQSWRKK